MHWRRKWQPTPVFLPGDSQGRRALVGLRLWGCTESDRTETTQQQQQQCLCCCTWTFPICGNRGYSLVVVCWLLMQWLLSLRSTGFRVCGLSGCSSQALGHVGSFRLSRCGIWVLAVPWYKDSSRTRDRIPVPGICRQILNPWTIREVPFIIFCCCC